MTEENSNIQNPQGNEGMAEPVLTPEEIEKRAAESAAPTVEVESPAPEAEAPQA